MRAAHVLLFLSALLGTSTGIRWLDTMPFWGPTRTKLAYLVSTDEPIDTLFLGTSRVAFGIDPELFDARMAELGVPCRSFNLGMSGHRSHDTSVVIDWLAEHRPKALRRVVLELHSWNQRIRGGQWWADQELELHRLDLLVPRLRSIPGTIDPIGAKLEQAGFVVAHTLVNTLRIGQGPRILRNWLAGLRGQTSPPPKVDRRGLRLIESMSGEQQLREHAKFVANPDAEKQILNKIGKIDPKWLAGGFDHQEFHWQMRRLRDAGIEPIVLIAPTWTCDFLGRDGVALESPNCRILELDRPEQNRPIYDRDLFHDPSHVNTAGVAKFSRYLADCVVEIEALPIGASIRPRLLHDRPLQLQVEWIDGRRALRCVAKDAPFAGSLIVGASRRTDTVNLPGNLRMGIPYPPPASTELKRPSLFQAVGELDLAALPGDGPVHVQLGVVVDGGVVAVSDVVTVPPR